MTDRTPVSETSPNPPGRTEPRPAETAPLEVGQERRRRILDYQQQSLADPDPLRANLAFETGNIMHMAQRMAEEIESALAEARAGLPVIGIVGREFGTYLQLTRQMDRFAQLEIRLAEGKEQQNGGPERRPPRR